MTLKPKDYKGGASTLQTDSKPWGRLALLKRKA